MNLTDNIRGWTGMPDLTLLLEQTKCVFFSFFCFNTYELDIFAS